MLAALAVRRGPRGQLVLQAVLLGQPGFRMLPGRLVLLLGLRAPLVLGALKAQQVLQELQDQQGPRVQWV